MHRKTPAAFAATFLAGILMLGGTALAEDNVERNSCLRYDQIDALHQLDTSHIILEVDGGQTLYLIEVEDRCFTNSMRDTITIEESGRNGCMRTTDRVSHGRRRCRIEDFTLIETEAQMREALAETE